MKEKFKALLNSRRFWVAIAGILTVVASDVFGVELGTEQMVAFTTIVSAWIIGDTLRATE